MTRGRLDKPKMSPIRGTKAKSTPSFADRGAKIDPTVTSPFIGCRICGALIDGSDEAGLCKEHHRLADSTKNRPKKTREMTKEDRIEIKRRVNQRFETQKDVARSMGLSLGQVHTALRKTR